MNPRINKIKIILLMYLFIFQVPVIVSAEELTVSETTLKVIDMMNSLLVLICSIFIFAIVGTLRDRRLMDLIRSAHFFKIKEIISAWTLIGSAVVLYSITEVIYVFNLMENGVAYRILKTIFGVLFAAGLFLQYRVLLKYIKQGTRKNKRGG